MRTTKQVTTHINSAFVFLRNGIIEKKRLVKNRTDRRKSCIVHHTAVKGTHLHICISVAAPYSSNIS